MVAQASALLCIRRRRIRKKGGTSTTKSYRSHLNIFPSSGVLNYVWVFLAVCRGKEPLVAGETSQTLIEEWSRLPEGLRHLDKKSLGSFRKCHLDYSAVWSAE